MQETTFMHTTLRYVLTAMIFIAFLACNKDNDTSSIVKGNWDYQYRSGSIAGGNYDSSKPGFRFQLKLTAGGKYSYYRNDTLRQSGSYSLSDEQKQDSYTYGSIRFMPAIDVYIPAKAFYTWYDATLIIHDGMADGYSYIYKRIPTK